MNPPFERTAAIAAVFRTQFEDCITSFREATVHHRRMLKALAFTISPLASLALVTAFGLPAVLGCFGIAAIAILASTGDSGDGRPKRSDVSTGGQTSFLTGF